MYIELEKDFSKKRFSQILDETQLIVEEKLLEADQSEEYELWTTILAQIKDIREKIVNSRSLTDWEDIYERYSIGQLGLQLFEPDDEMHMRLCDIFYGAVHYIELSNE